MRAMELKTMFTGVNYDAERNYQCHRERLKKIKKSIDNDVPFAYEHRSRSPQKKLLAKQAIKENVYKENFFLAKRIFDIMEGESQLSEMINDTRHLDNHPGTMNFKQRLEEAQRIHYHNMLLASRLNTVQPHYKVEDLSVYRSIKSPRASSPRSKKTRFLRELEYTLRIAGGGGQFRTPRGYTGEGGLDDPNARGWSPTDFDQSQRAVGFREDGEGDYGNSEVINNVMLEQGLKPGGGGGGVRPRSIVLEYTKVQQNRVLDIAVVKEPYRDRYIIYGKDIEDGQRFELQLSSEDVSNILDGDILVTSVDNVEVWMALLHKIELQPVDQFSKLTMIPPPPEAEFSIAASQQKPPQLIPSAPDGYTRPSDNVRSSKASNPRQGHRVIRDKKKEVDEPVMQEVDKNLVKIEDAAKARLRLIAKEKKKKNQKEGTPVASANPVEDVPPIVSPRPETEVTTTPTKSIKDKAKVNSPRQPNQPKGSLDAYTSGSQPVRKPVVTRTSITETTTATTAANVATTTTTSSNTNPVNAAVKPRPPNKPSASFPSANNNTTQAAAGNKRNNAAYKNRANTIEKANPNQTIPRAIANAVAATTLVTNETKQPSRPRTALEKQIFHEQLQQTVQSVVERAIAQAVTNLTDAAAVKRAMTGENEENMLRVPFNTLDYNEVSASFDPSKLKVNPFPAIDVDKNIAASPLHRQLQENGSMKETALVNARYDLMEDVSISTANEESVQYETTVSRASGGNVLYESSNALTTNSSRAQNSSAGKESSVELKGGSSVELKEGSSEMPGEYSEAKATEGLEESYGYDSNEFETSNN